MSPPDQRPGVRGACPGAHTPFLEADGALVRVRIPGGALSAAQLRVCASVGGTALEITSRANLQIRGLDPSGVPAVVDALVAAGLVLPDAAQDERRNVMASPTAGFDGHELLDTRPVVAAVAAVLADSGAAVSPKFGVLIDGGGSVSVRSRRLDICLGAFLPEGGDVPWFEVRLDEPLPVNSEPGRRVGQRDDAEADTVVVPAGRATDVVKAVVDLCPPGGRAADLIDRYGRPYVLAMVAARSGGEVTTLTPPVRDAVTAIGVHPGAGNSVWCGAAPLLGRLDPVVAQALAQLADDFGPGELRLTPWRGVIFGGLPSDVTPPPTESWPPSGSAMARLVDALERLGLSTDASDPLHQVIACAGSAGCHAGLTDTQVDAARLVTMLRGTAPDVRPGTVHLSGCPKSCATRGPCDLTLVGGPAPGTYELYRRREAQAAFVLSAPEFVGSNRHKTEALRETMGFGERVAGGLSPEAALATVCGVAT